MGVTLLSNGEEGGANESTSFICLSAWVRVCVCNCRGQKGRVDQREEKQSCCFLLLLFFSFALSN
jgi:hypothetical protein